MKITMEQIKTAKDSSKNRKRAGVSTLLQQAAKTFEQGQFAQAKECLFTVLQQKPQHWQALNDLGVVLFQEANFAEAERYFHQSLRSKPNNLDAQLNLIHLYWEQNKYFPALMYSLKVFQRFGKRAEAKSILLEVCAGIVQQFCFSDASNLEQELLRLQSYPKLVSEIERVLEQKQQWRQQFSKQQCLFLEAAFALMVKDLEWFILNLNRLKPEAQTHLEVTVLFIWGLLLGNYVFDANLLIQQLSKTRPDNQLISYLRDEYRRRKSNPQVQQLYRKILIVMDQGIGNMVMLTPTIQAIKHSLPNSEITVLGRQPALEILTGWEAVKAVVTEPPSEHFDVGFFTIWSQDFAQKYGEQIESQCRTIYHSQIKNPDVHESDHYFEIARILGFEGEKPAPFCATEKADISLPTDKKIVALADTTLNGRDWERKRWPYYPQLAHELVKQGYAVVLIGGAGEAERFQPEKWPTEIINCMGKLSLPQTANVLKKCDLFIGNDSGPAHMAAALGIKTYVIFGPTRVKKNKPLGKEVSVISKNLPCQPCQYTENWKRCKNWRCMKELSVSEVMSSLIGQYPPEKRGPIITVRASSLPTSLLLMGKDYSDCHLELENNLLYITRQGVKERLRIQLVGARWANFPWGMENEVFRAFEKAGCEVFDTDYRLQQKNFVELFMRPAHLVIVFKGSGIPPELIHQHPGRTILWYPDDIFTTAHARRDIAYNAWAFDTVYSFDKSALEEYRKYGVRDARWLPLAMSPAVHRKMYLPKKYDISFVGHLYPNRRVLIERLQRRFNILVKQAFMDEMVLIFNQSKIVLNLGIGPTGIQSRVFEALGCGSFLLTNEIPEDSRLFQDREHLVYFNDKNVEELAEYYLKHDEEREAIALAGYRETYANHTYEHRTWQILNEHIGAGDKKDKWTPASVIIHKTSIPRRRLIVFWHGIGDNIMATPALRTLRRKYPKDHLAYMYLRRIYKDRLMEGSPFIDALYPCSDAWDDYPDYGTGVQAVLQEAQQIAQHQKYDEIIPVTLRACSLHKHRIERIAYELGVTLDSWDTELPLSKEDRKQAEQIFRRWGIKNEDFVIAIHRRGANIHKLWEITEAQKFIDYMRKYFNATFIALETHTDLNREHDSQFQGEGIFSTSRLKNFSLKVATALIERCNLFVGLDSGPMWLATTTKTPIIALFTMTWMHQSAPMRENCFIVCSQKSREMAIKSFKLKHADRIIYSEHGGTKIAAEDVIRCVELMATKNILPLSTTQKASKLNNYHRTQIEYENLNGIKLQIKDCGPDAIKFRQIVWNELPDPGLLPSPKGKAKILDLGCDTGYNTKLLAEKYGDAVGIDLNPNLIFHSTANWNKCLVGDMHYLPFRKDTFDLVFAKDVLEHSYRPQQVLHDILHVLKPAGYLIALIPLDGNGEVEGGNPTHIWKTTQSECNTTFRRAGYKEVKFLIYSHEKITGRRRSLGDEIAVVVARKEKQKSQKFISKLITLPKPYYGPGAYWGAFLTLRCTSNCKYCIQKIDRKNFEIARKIPELSGKEWIDILNRLEHPKGQRLAITGGEPSLHPDFIEILNQVEDYFITITTNLHSPFFDNLEENLNKLHPRSKIRINTSFHPKFISAEQFIHRIRVLQEKGFWVDQIAMVDHPGSKYSQYQEQFARAGIHLSAQSMLGIWEGKLYPDPQNTQIKNDPNEHGIVDYERYREGFSAQQQKSILCQIYRFLIAPDGNVYNCHYHLYSHQNDWGNLKEGQINLPEDFFFCNHYGFCNPCDFPHVKFRKIGSDKAENIATCVSLANNRTNSIEYNENYFWKSEKRTRYVFEPAARFLKLTFNPTKVLDVGCGSGFLIKWLRTDGVEAYGCDYSKWAIEHISDPKFLTPNKIDVRPFVQVAKIEKLPYKDNSFDLVTCLDVFEHLELPQAIQAVKELERVTSRFLFMIITVHNEPNKDLILPKGAKNDPTHVMVTSKEYWQRLFARETNLLHRADLEQITYRSNFGQILPWTFFIYEKQNNGIKEKDVRYNFSKKISKPRASQEYCLLCGGENYLDR